MQQPGMIDGLGNDAPLRGHIASTARLASGAAALARGIEPRCAPLDEAWESWTEALGAWARRREMAVARVDAAVSRIEEADADWARSIHRCAPQLNWGTS
ncbi:hypothetical protein HT102_08005 [Hoyosella sp. G463]|uniref:Uncharacterized protein n=1 Tax=Lolliginicoccus lacisalsi TaxID=2742202 RepID=A0A927JBT9_9ACTN|nr:hypothetical protein [Lolliginicoccus lacisalsi]MBD8506424.1 hypothetical protein [Lolliginicoccus lacisalsi]